MHLTLSYKGKAPILCRGGEPHPNMFNFFTEIFFECLIVTCVCGVCIVIKLLTDHRQVCRQHIEVTCLFHCSL